MVEPVALGSASWLFEVVGPSTASPIDEWLGPKSSLGAATSVVQLSPPSGRPVPSPMWKIA